MKSITLLALAGLFAARLPAAEKLNVVFILADWFPTLCEAAGLKKPAGLDGESFWPALTSGKSSARTKPMIWVFPEYGGQVAVQLGQFKLVRQGLKTKTPGPWEVYDLTKDHAEANDLAASRADLIQQADDLLRREVADNTIFPVSIPGVNNVAR